MILYPSLKVLSLSHTHTLCVVLLSKFAWRLVEKTNDNHMLLIKHDNDDDGEDGAGSRLAQLLEFRQDDGVLLVVSRWFGGIHVGPKRFGHIVNVARQVLVNLGHDDDDDAATDNTA